MLLLNIEATAAFFPKRNVVNVDARFAPDVMLLHLFVKSLHVTADMHLFLDRRCAARLTSNSIPTIQIPPEKS